MPQLALIAEAKPAPVIEFSVAGEVLAQGSKVAYVRNGRAVLVDMADKKTKTRKAGALKRWKESIWRKADVQIRGDLIGPVHLWRGPIILECVFVVPRSPSHFTSKGALKKSAPRWPQKDLDKLIRAVGDSLSKVIYWDDVQIVGFGASTKRFAKTRGGAGGVYVKIWEDLECG